MKKQEKLIREYYGSRGITHGSPLLFSYFTRNRDGREVVEYWAAKYGHVRGRKGKDIVAKCVMRFCPDTNRYAMSDSVIRYQTWSRMMPDHLIYDFRKEMAGCNSYPDKIGIGRLYSHANWRGEVMPTSEIPLNGCGDGRYKYCKYAFKDIETCEGNNRSFHYWGRNPYGNLPDFLKKFDLNPRAMEMFAERGLVKFMKEHFLIRLRDDKPFARWYKSHALATLNRTITQIYSMARKDLGKTCWEIVDNEERRLERIRRKRLARLRMARQEREEERRRIEAEKREKVERMNRAKRIRRLYEKLKSICGAYGAYEVRVPKSEREMMAEGERMHNCVGKCYASRQGLDAIVVFLWRNGKPCVDIEVDPETFEVVQCRRTCNKNSVESERKIAEKVAADIEEIYKKAA